MHVAVPSACNIQGNSCNRKQDCSSESRPGVVGQKLSRRAADHVTTSSMAMPGD